MWSVFGFSAGSAIPVENLEINGVFVLLVVLLDVGVDECMRRGGVGVLLVARVVVGEEVEDKIKSIDRTSGFVKKWHVLICNRDTKNGILVGSRKVVSLSPSLSSSLSLSLSLSDEKGS